METRTYQICLLDLIKSIIMRYRKKILDVIVSETLIDETVFVKIWSKWMCPKNSR